MKKYFLFGLMVAIMPNLCCGASARYTQLVREKQQKMEELEKCMGSSNGLKIAGISTLGLTAVGVAGNIYEAKEIKKNVATIDENNTAIEKKEKENKKLAEKKAEKEAQEKLIAECKTKFGSGSNLDKITSVEKDESDNCKILTCEDGYKPNNVGNDCEKTLKEELKTVMSENEIDCLEKIKKLLSENGEDVYKEKINNIVQNQSDSVVDKNERITFNGQTKECRVNQKYIDCLGVDFIQQLAFAQVEVELMSSQCGINKELIVSVEEFDQP